MLYTTVLYSIVFKVLPRAALTLILPFLIDSMIDQYNTIQYSTLHYTSLHYNTVQQYSTDDWSGDLGPPACSKPCSTPNTAVASAV